MMRASVVATGLLALACGERAERSSDPELTGLRAFDRAARAGAAFSGHYVAAPPEGELPQIIITPSIEQPCSELYEQEERAESLDFWFIKVVLGERRAGDFEVVAGEDPRPGEAVATLQRASQGKTATRVPAIGGRVEVDEPVFDDGAELEADLRLDFPVAPVTTVECNENATLDGVVTRTCVCEQADGSRSECTTDEPQASCCRGESDAGVDSVELSTGATFCARMCSALVGLEGYCHPLP